MSGIPNVYSKSVTDIERLQKQIDRMQKQIDIMVTALESISSNRDASEIADIALVDSDRVEIVCGFCGGSCNFQGDTSEEVREYRCQKCSKVFQLMTPKGDLPPYPIKC